MADALLGIYLVVVLLGDLYLNFISDYIFTDTFWQEGFICKAAMGFLNISSIMSNGTLFLKSVIFYLATKHPFKVRSLQMKKKALFMVSAQWCIIIILCLLLSVFYEPKNKLCSFYFTPIKVKSSDEVIWGLSIIMFLALSQVLCLTLDFCSSWTIEKSNQNVSKSHINKISPIKIIMPGLTSFICTFLKLLALLIPLGFDKVVGTPLIVLSTWVVSINCAVNPIMFNINI